jgi:hypothetical protein
MPDEREMLTVISLSDSEMDERVARPLSPKARGAFLEQLGHALVGRREVGPGELHRILAELQPAFATPPRYGPQPPQQRRVKG